MPQRAATHLEPLVVQRLDPQLDLLGDVFALQAAGDGLVRLVGKFLLQGLTQDLLHSLWDKSARPSYELLSVFSQWAGL